VQAIRIFHQASRDRYINRPRGGKDDIRWDAVKIFSSLKGKRCRRAGAVSGEVQSDAFTEDANNSEKIV